LAGGEECAGMDLFVGAVQPEYRHVGQYPSG
jgi:hypothetical protein